MSRKYRCFLHLYDFRLPKQTSQKHEYLQYLDKTTCKKVQCFETICYIFSARAPQFKNQSVFYPVASASGKTCPLHLPVRADFDSVVILQPCSLWKGEEDCAEGQCSTCSEDHTLSRHVGCSCSLA